MPKSFLVKRKCCPPASEGDIPTMSLEKEVTESDAQTLEMSDNDFRRTSVITHGALAVDYNNPVRNEQTRKIARKAFTEENMTEVNIRHSEVKENPLTLQDFQWLMGIRASSIQLREVFPMYDYTPHSPSSSVESPLSPASCHSADVPREEIEQMPFLSPREKLIQFREDRSFADGGDEAMWRNSSCPSPVFPCQPVKGIRKNGGQRDATATELKPKHTCKDCGKSFLRASSLSNHKLIHRNVKAFHCDKCGMSFLRKSDLGKHIVTHTGIKPYQCDICYKRFSQSSNMLTHRRRHTGTRPFSCRHCGKAFYRKVDVRRHSRIHQ